MPEIRVVTNICAPRERVFDLARSIDAHIDSTSRTQERAIEGVTSGLIEMDDTVTWEAKHFGIRQRLKVKITAFEYPEMFADEMVFGAFKMMRHTHRFIEAGDNTEMIDEFIFEAPMGVLGKIAEKLFVTQYMKSFLIKRNQVLRDIAESDAWKKFLVNEEN